MFHRQKKISRMYAITHIKVINRRGSTCVYLLDSLLLVYTG